MNYYIDTEFLEGPQKEKFPISLLRKETKPTIDLISIGIVSEDGREYYAISKDFNLKEAWNRWQPDRDCSEFEKEYWIRENVLKPIWLELTSKEHEWNHEVLLENLKGDFSDIKSMTYKDLKSLIGKYGKTNKEIAEEIKIFTTQYSNKADEIWDKPKFYAYYADYDWVVFCQLFGKMIDLPNGFPMYCNDLKQEIDNVPDQPIRNHVSYPKQQNEHNALEDARWNKKLHEFLNKL